MELFLHFSGIVHFVSSGYFFITLGEIVGTPDMKFNGTLLQRWAGR
jgi:hypothetical protein